MTISNEATQELERILGAMIQHWAAAAQQSNNEVTRECAEELRSIVMNWRRPLPPLNEDQAIIEAATPGPWRVSDAHGLCVMQGTSPQDDKALVADLDPTGTEKGWRGRRADAEFIARAREGWPKDRAEVERLQARVTELETGVQKAYGYAFRPDGHGSPVVKVRHLDGLLPKDREGTND